MKILLFKYYYDEEWDQPYASPHCEIQPHPIYPRSIANHVSRLAWLANNSFHRIVTSTGSAKILDTIVILQFLIYFLIANQAIKVIMPVAALQGTQSYAQW